MHQKAAPLTSELSEPVEGDVGEQEVLADAVLNVAVAIGPGVELLCDPGCQACRGVVQGIAQRLRLCGLDLGVACTRRRLMPQAL